MTSAATKSNARAASIAATLPELSQRPTFIVHQLNAELARICNPLFRRLHVDLITSRILVILLERQNAYVGDVVEMMALPQSTVSHQIKRLVDAGLVERRADAADNRVYVVSLTRKGRQVADECNAISERIYAEVFGDFDARELESLVRNLETMGAKLKSLKASALDRTS